MGAFLQGLRFVSLLCNNFTWLLSHYRGLKPDDSYERWMTSLRMNLTIYQIQITALSERDFWLATSDENPWIPRSSLSIHPWNKDSLDVLTYFIFCRPGKTKMLSIFFFFFLSLINLPSQYSSCQWEIWYLEKFISMKPINTE